MKSIVRAAIHWRRAPVRLWAVAMFPDPDPCRLGDKPWFGVVRVERRVAA